MRDYRAERARRRTRPVTSDQDPEIAAIRGRLATGYRNQGPASFGSAKRDIWYLLHELDCIRANAARATMKGERDGQERE